MKPKKKSRLSTKKKSAVKPKFINTGGPSGICTIKKERSSPVESEEEDAAPVPPQKASKKRQLYARETLLAAYEAVRIDNIAVHAAAKKFGVPLTTLRDRVDGRISMETTRPGPPLLLAHDEEEEITHFLHTMARYGYRYTRLELGEIATDQAIEKGKKNPRSNGLTTKWVDNFIGRWPSLRQLSCKFKSKSDAEVTVRTYFDEIKKIIDRYRLLEKTDRIFNIMEMGLHTDHGGLPGADKRDNISHTTVIACGSVSGRVLPPFFVFQAARLRPEMMRGVPSNCNAAVSESGRVTPQIFRRYLNEHFLPQTQRGRHEVDDPILVLMDGAKSHVFVSLAEWGRSNNIIFSFVPAHTTHLLQPLEVECLEGMQRKYESCCRKYFRHFSFSRLNIAELAWQAYFKVINRQAVVHAFKKVGVYPEVTSDESEDESKVADTGDTYRPKYKIKSEDSNSCDREEVVFTDDLVVAHNEEITEEEVVTSTQEVVLSGEPVDDCNVAMETVPRVSVEGEARLQESGEGDGLFLTPDGQLMLRHEGGSANHVVIQGGGFYLKGPDGKLRAVTLMQEEMEVKPSNLEHIKVSPLKQCVISDGKAPDISSAFTDPNFDPAGSDSLASPESGQVAEERRRLTLSPRDADVNCSGGSNTSGVFSGLDEVALGIEQGEVALGAKRELIMDMGSGSL